MPRATTLTVCGTRSVVGEVNWTKIEDAAAAKAELLRPEESMSAGTKKMTREIFIDAQNEDLSREYQAIIAYVNYSQVLKGAAYMNIAAELTVHAKQELDHALQIANHVDYLGGMPSVTPKSVKTSEKAEDMLKFDLENERVTIANYRRRVKQADELNEFAIAESLRGILVDEQDHLIALATALGIDPPDAGIAD
jgi:bacterioferritin